MDSKLHSTMVDFSKNTHQHISTSDMNHCLSALKCLRVDTAQFRRVFKAASLLGLNVSGGVQWLEPQRAQQNLRHKSNSHDKSKKDLALFAGKTN